MNSSEKKTTPKHWNVKNAAILRKLVSQNKWKRHIHLKKCYTGSSGLPQIIPNMAHKPALKTENKTFCWLGWKQTVRLDEERRWRKYSLWEQEYRRCRRPKKTRQKISQSSKQPSHTASGLRVNTHTHTHTRIEVLVDPQWDYSVPTDVSYTTDGGLMSQRLTAGSTLTFSDKSKLNFELQLKHKTISPPYRYVEPAVLFTLVSNSFSKKKNKWQHQQIKGD